MKKNDKRSGGRRAVLVALVALAATLIAHPPQTPAQVTTTKPIKIDIKTPKTKKDSFKGEVISYTNAAVTVRDRKNFALVRTFSFSPELTRKLENRRLEPGDRVTVVYERGSDTAVKLKGKLRKDELPLNR